SEDTRRVAARMIELMFEAEGIGLAAPQVGLPWRMFVVHVPAADDRPLPPAPSSPSPEPHLATPTPLVLIDPILSNPQGTLESYDEGCLRLPDITGDVLRPPTITITAKDLDGREFTRTASGLL